MGKVYCVRTIEIVSNMLSFTEKYIDLVGYDKPCRGFVNTIWPSNKTVKYCTPNTSSQ